MPADTNHEVGLGKAIELRRTELGLKRRELAERANLSYPYISEIENGVKEPSAKALRRIADALEMKLADLAALTERVEDTAGQSSILLSAIEPPAMAVVQDAIDYPGRLTSGSPAVLRRSVPAEPRQGERPRAEDPILRAVREELDRWRREELPELVRAEVERLLNARDVPPDF